MHAKELDSFIFKFKHLWRSGYDAHLNINTHAGQAWVDLRVRLGHAEGPHHVNKAKNGPSRQRRRERRAESRNQSNDASVEESAKVSEEVVEDKTNDTNKEATEEVDILVNSEPDSKDSNLVETDTTEKVVETEEMKLEREK